MHLQSPHQALQWRTTKSHSQLRWHRSGSSSASAGALEEEAQCTFSPRINPVSERLLEDSSSLPANFFERQRFFHEMREARLQQLQADSVSPACAGLQWLAGCVSRLHRLVQQLPADSLLPACLPPKSRSS